MDKPCKLWTGKTISNGRAGHVIKAARNGSKETTAYALACEQQNGSRPPGMDASHLCQNKLCYEPTHMVWETRRDNMLRIAVGQRITAAARAHLACGIEGRKARAKKGRATLGVAGCSAAAKRGWDNRTNKRRRRVDSTLKLQAELQANYAKLFGMKDPQKLDTVFDAVAYIKDMRDHLNNELTELLEEIAGSRQQLKPWTNGHSIAMAAQYEITDKVKLEAIDAYCFLMNILLAAGVDGDNVKELYAQVHAKNKARQTNEYLNTHTNPSAVDKWIEGGKQIG